MRNGVMIKAGTVIEINNVWNSASAAIVVPALNPNSVENIMPAHVGQPTNNPPVRPILCMKETLFFYNLVNLRV